MKKPHLQKILYYITNKNFKIIHQDIILINFNIDLS